MAYTAFSHSLGEVWLRHRDLIRARLDAEADGTNKAAIIRSIGCVAALHHWSCRSFCHVSHYNITQARKQGCSGTNAKGGQNDQEAPVRLAVEALGAFFKAWEG